MGIFVTTDLADETCNKLNAFIKTFGLPHVIRKDQYHITVAYSKADFPYSLGLHLDGIKVNPIGFDVFGEESKVLVLKVEHPELTKRHYELREQGATSDYPDYKAHITVAVVPGDFDASRLPLPDFPIEIKYEYAKPIKKSFSYSPLSMCEGYLPSFREHFLTEQMLLAEANIDDTWKIHGAKIHARMAEKDFAFGRGAGGEEDYHEAIYANTHRMVDKVYPDLINRMNSHKTDVRADAEQEHNNLTNHHMDSVELSHGESEAKQIFHNHVKGLNGLKHHGYGQPDDVENKTTQKYLPWIAKEYANGNIKRLEDIGSTVADSLEKFDSIKKSPKNSAELGINRDINHYHLNPDKHIHEPYKDGLYELTPQHHAENAHALAHNARNLHTAINAIPDHMLPQPELEPHEYTKIDEKHWTIVQPHTQKAACKYGAGTQWCTAARNNNMFNHYDQTGKLSIFIPKNPTHVGEKYQLHISKPVGEPPRGLRISLNYRAPEAQFMNEKDDPAHPADAGLTHWFDESSHGPLPRSGQALGGPEYGFDSHPPRYSEHFHDRVSKEWRPHLRDVDEHD